MSRRGFVALIIITLACVPGFAIPRNVILITIDTTRADRMGFLGSTRGLTPHLDTLAQESVVFTHAYAQAPVTTASHATILTGTYPQFHKVNDAGVPLAADVPFAPAIFRVRGYQTAAFVGAVILDPKAGGAPGFDRGFDTYDAGFRDRGPGQSRYATLERRGGDVVAHALAWLGKHNQHPFFLWVHLYDPHAPYDPPQPFRGRYPSDLYDGEIAYADSVAGTLLDGLRANKAYDNSVIAVMADHGEAFGEHGERGHGVFLYSPTIHVPLLIKFPAGSEAAKRVDSRVSLVDVLPTLLESVNIPAPATMQGKSLLPVIRDKAAAANRASYAETDYPRRAFGWSSLRALRSEKYLLVQAPRKELYDETADPGDDHDLSSKATAVTGTLNAQLDQFREKTASARSAPRAALDPGQEQKLRALGYVSSSESTNRESEVSGTDPKDKIALANEMTDANLALEEGRAQEAILRLRGIVAQDPSFAPAYAVLGTALTEAGDFRGAIPVLKKAIELRPGSVSSHYELGMALFQAGDLHAAAPQFEAAVAGSPRSADMHYSLASVYVRMDRMTDARRELQKALALRPNHYLANVMLGQVFLVQKSPAQALPYLQKAEKLQPEAAQVHQLLADAYTQLGQKSAAERERALAQPH